MIDDAISIGGVNLADPRIYAERMLEDGRRLYELTEITNAGMSGGSSERVAEAGMQIFAYALSTQHLRKPSRATRTRQRQ